LPDPVERDEDIDSPPLFGTWLQQTRVLQTLSFGQDPGELEGDAKANFITWNYAEMCVELGEMMNEYPGHKTWVTDRTRINRTEFIAEMVDALHFAGNILAAVGCDDREFSAAYQLKMNKNAARMASKVYDGVSDKCPECKRELQVYPATANVAEAKFCPEHGRVM